MRRADLHLHTHASSDASFDPEEVFSIALARGLTALTFSDHDCIDSLAEGQRLSAVYGLTFLPGIEITSSWRGGTGPHPGLLPRWPAPFPGGFSGREILGGEKTPQSRHRGVHAGAGRDGDHRRLRRRGRGSGSTSRGHSTSCWSRRALCRTGKSSGPYRRLPASSFAARWFRRPSEPVTRPAASPWWLIPATTPASSSPSTKRTSPPWLPKGSTVSRSGIPRTPEAQEEEYVRVADRLGLVKTGGSDMHIPRPEPQKMVGGTYCDWDEVLRYLER